MDEAVQPGEVLYYVKAMVDTFCRHGNYENRAKARTRFMQDTLGPEGLKEAFLKNVESAKAEGCGGRRSRPPGPGSPCPGRRCGQSRPRR